MKHYKIATSKPSASFMFKGVRIVVVNGLVSTIDPDVIAKLQPLADDEAVASVSDVTEKVEQQQALQAELYASQRELASSLAHGIMPSAPMGKATTGIVTSLTAGGEAAGAKPTPEQLLANIKANKPAGE